MERLRSIFDGMFDGVLLVAADGRTTYANAAMGRMLGLTPDGLRGRRFTDFLEESRRADTDAFLDRQRVHAGERLELQLRRDDGGDLLALVAGSPILTDDGIFVGTMLNVSDVTGKRAIDAQVIQNQRLEAIGEFAGGIAHDFNNLLTAIQGYAELALVSLPEGDPIREDLAQVLAGTGRASAITRRLLAFTRRQILVPVDVDPVQVIEDLLPILKPLMSDDIEMVLDLPGKHGWIRVDPAQLEQVIVNLAINARDAMPTGGSVTFAVHDLEPVDPERPDQDLNPGPYVRISVADTGVGMDAETTVRIFDPFFTTKSLGRGTGLGLSTVLGIVTQSGGQIQVQTAIGRGTTFNVDLPRVEAGAPPVACQIEGPPGHPSCVVLLAEDDAAVRELARRSLESAGHRVLSTSDSEHALRTSERWAETIDVLVTDLVMPGIHGLELAAGIRAQRPDIGVVFMSGYAEDAIGRGSELASAGEYLPKPFTVDGLRRAVDRAASEARSRAGRPGPVASPQPRPARRATHAR